MTIISLAIFSLVPMYVKEKMSKRNETFVFGGHYLELDAYGQEQ